MKRAGLILVDPRRRGRNGRDPPAASRPIRSTSSMRRAPMATGVRGRSGRPRRDGVPDAARPAHRAIPRDIRIRERRFARVLPVRGGADVPQRTPRSGAEPGAGVDRTRSQQRRRPHACVRGRRQRARHADRRRGGRRDLALHRRRRVVVAAHQPRPDPQRDLHRTGSTRGPDRHLVRRLGRDPRLDHQRDALGLALSRRRHLQVDRWRRELGAAAVDLVGNARRPPTRSTTSSTSRPIPPTSRQDEVLAATFRGIYRSIDGGGSWNQVLRVRLRIHRCGDHQRGSHVRDHAARIGHARVALDQRHHLDRDPARHLHRHRQPRHDRPRAVQPRRRLLLHPGRLVPRTQRRRPPALEVHLPVRRRIGRGRDVGEPRRQPARRPQHPDRLRPDHHGQARRRELRPDRRHQPVPLDQRLRDRPDHHHDRRVPVLSGRNHHPDLHAGAFSPADPNVYYSAGDGGIVEGGEHHAGRTWCGRASTTATTSPSSIRSRSPPTPAAT